MSFELGNIHDGNFSLLHLLTENLPDMLWIKDLEGKYIYANKALCDSLLMANDTQEPIGKSDVFFALREREKHKDNPDWHTFGELCFNSDQVVIDANQSMKFEEYGNVKGKLLYLEVNKAPFYDKDKNIIGTVGSGRDITELKMIQFKLSQQAQIIEQIHDCIITTNIDGEILSWNNSAEKLFGYKEDEVLKQNINILFTEEDFTIMQNNINELYINEEHSSSIQFLSKEKDIIITNLNLSLLRDTDKNIIRIIYYIKDITDKEKLSQEIKKQENIITSQAHHVSMGEMIGNIAHQWRQPLSTITVAATGLITLSEHDLVDKQKISEMCTSINDNAQYLSQTIDDFRNFIKGARVFKQFNLQENIESFLKLVNGTIKSKNLNILLDINSKTEIKSYPHELHQALMNIFNNAKDALNTNKENNRIISISVVEDNAYITIEIQDNAGGIKEEIFSRIFEPYFTTKHQSQGTGLGLHMTYKLVVEGMNGDIQVANKEFELNSSNHYGACFTIILPKNI